MADEANKLLEEILGKMKDLGKYSIKADEKLDLSKPEDRKSYRDLLLNNAAISITAVMQLDAAENLSAAVEKKYDTEKQIVAYYLPNDEQGTMLCMYLNYLNVKYRSVELDRKDGIMELKDLGLSVLMSPVLVVDNIIATGSDLFTENKLDKSAVKETIFGDVE